MGKEVDERNSKNTIDPTNTTLGDKKIKILGIGFRELKFFIIIFWMIGYCIRHWINPAVLSRINPPLPSGGKSQSSKKYNYDYFTKDNIITKSYYAKCVAIPKEANFSEIKKILSIFDKNIIVLKPDKGARSIGVKVTTTDDERIQLLNVRKNNEYIAQEYIPYQHELGVYYYRYPNQNQGNILGIAEKKFDMIIGNGKSSLKQLLKNITITKAIQTQLLYSYKTLKYIPHNGEKILLANTVDHSDDGDYYNRPDLITPDVEKIFNKIIGNKEIYFCRFDIRAKDLYEFTKGKEFKILEINTGPNAVFLHAFDPRYTKRKQLQICFNEYKKAFKIAQMLKNTPRRKLIPYIWFTIEDEIPLFFLRHRIEKLEKNTRTKNKF